MVGPPGGTAVGGCAGEFGCLRDLALQCAEKGHYESMSFSEMYAIEIAPMVDLAWHARRIAYLMQYGWSDPLLLDVGVKFKTGALTPVRVLDGHHRLAAAILLNHEFAQVDYEGSVFMAEERFGQEFMALPDLVADDYIQVAESGYTVWVHGVDDTTLGRFDWRFGMDVHATLAAQVNGAGQCLRCTHEPAKREDWLEFCGAMWKHHGLFVDEAIFSLEGEMRDAHLSEHEESSIYWN